MLCGMAGAYLAIAPRGPAERTIYRWFLFKDWIGRDMKL